jgi:rubrerythrin
MKSMTKDALLSAFGGESMAHMRYLVFAVQAEREGFPNIARLLGLSLMQSMCMPLITITF